MKTVHVKNVAGLRDRPTYEELIDYIETSNDKIKMPDRRAQFLRNSFYLSQLDGEGMRQQEQMEQMRDAMQDRELLVRQFARDYGFQYRDIDAWLQGRGLRPVRREQPAAAAEEQYDSAEEYPLANVPPLQEARVAPRGRRRRAPAEVMQPGGAPQMQVTGGEPRMDVARGSGYTRDVPRRAPMQGITPASQMGGVIGQPQRMAQEMPYPMRPTPTRLGDPDVMRLMSPLEQRARRYLQGPPGTPAPKGAVRRRQTQFHSIGTPPTPEVRRSLDAEFADAEDIAQQAADAGVPSSVMRRVGGALGSAVGSVAAAAASTVRERGPGAAAAVGRGLGRAAATVPGVLGTAVHMTVAGGMGFIEGITSSSGDAGALPQRPPQPYGFVFEPRGREFDSGTMDPQAIFDQQQMDLRDDPQSYAYLDVNQAQLVQARPPMTPAFQPEAFERSAGAMPRAAQPQYPVYVPAAAVPPGFPGMDLEAELGALMDEEPEPPSSSSAAPARRRVQGKRQLTEMSQIFNPKTFTSPDQQVSDYISKRLRSLQAEPFAYQALVDDLLRQIRPGATKMAPATALTQIERRLMQKDVDPNDQDNRNLVIIYYIIKTLATQSPATDIRKLLQ